TITGTIPASTPYGKGYRIRIISSDLPLAGPGISDSISILRPPQAPILSFAGGYLISDVANVLWYGPAGRIYGAQSPYLPTASGDYYVVALDSNGCSSTSDTLSLNGEMLHTGLVASNDGIAIYPNPAQRHLFV